MKYVHALLIGCVAVVCCAVLAQAQGTGSVIYLPLVNSSTGATGQVESNTLTVAGTIHSTGAPMTSVVLWLWRTNPNAGGTSTPVDSYDWQSAGSDSFAYEFTNQPRLEDGSGYWVGYINLDKVPGFLDIWATSALGNPESGSVVTMPAFNIADVTLRDPDDGETKSLPEKFAWNARDWATDHYSVELFEENADGDVIRSVGTQYQPHPTDDVFVGRIEEGAGFLPGVPYKWRVKILDGLGGIGTGLDTHTVILRNADEQQAVNIEAVAIDSQASGPQINDIQLHADIQLHTMTEQGIQ